MPPVTPNGVITQYTIFYNETNINITDFNNSMLKGTVEELSPDTVYVLQLRAYTGAGAGALSSSITFLTRKLLFAINIRTSSTLFIVFIVFCMGGSKGTTVI